VADKYIGTHINKYPTLKYKYKYKYLKFVLEYWSSTSTSTKYYITASKYEKPRFQHTSISWYSHLVHALALCMACN